MNLMMMLLFSTFSLFNPLLVKADVYPQADWETSSPESEGIDSAKLAQFADYNFEETKDKKTDAILVIRHGKLVFEKYNFNYNQNMRHLSWSLAKSFSSIVFGIAESDGLIKRDSKMNEFYSYSASTPEEQTLRDQVTMMSLLTMSSGLQWNESYSRTAPLASDVTQMLYLNPRSDMAAYVASHPMRNRPDEHFYYSTGNTNVVMGSLKKVLSKDAYNAYPWVKLFNRIGMRNVVWEQDDAGTFAGGSYVYATARDYARFGYLLIKNGKWNDAQIVPSEWIKKVKELSPGFQNGTLAPQNPETYGAGFWINTPAPHYKFPAPYPAAPADTFLGIGHNGQSITMIPSLDLVVVRLAHDQIESGIDRAHYLDLILASLGAKKSLDAHLLHRDTFQKAEAVFDLPPPPTAQTAITHFPKLLAAVRAKDYCSCHFVVGQSDEFCRTFVLNGFPLIRLQVNESSKTATAGVISIQTARMTTEEFGCSFIDR